MNQLYWIPKRQNQINTNKPQFFKWHVVKKMYTKTILTTLPMTSAGNVCLDITQSALVRTFLSGLLTLSFNFKSSS